MKILGFNLRRHFPMMDGAFQEGACGGPFPLWTGKELEAAAERI